MKSINHSFEIETNKQIEVLNITEQVKDFVKKSEIKIGQVTVFTKHTTSAIFVNEDEEFLLKDFKEYLKERIQGRKFKHDNILERKDCPEDEPINGQAHIQAAFYLQPSLSLIIDDGELVLGKWQSVLFVELDGPCPRKHKSKRKIYFNAIGE
ncbi:MAG: secondary thiamine-phosphate synthase enzyme YjbQ [Candidatus Heimdallarchaeaceae archaeon]